MAATIGEDANDWDRAINFVNREFGEDLKSIRKARELLDGVRTRKNTLEQQVRN